MIVAGQDAAAEVADDSGPFGIGVDQDQLVEGQRVAQPREPVDQFGGVCGSPTHDGELHPLTPVNVTPSMKTRCAKMNTTITGAIDSSVAAMVRFQCTACTDL